MMMKQSVAALETMTIYNIICMCVINMYIFGLTVHFKEYHLTYEQQHFNVGYSFEYQQNQQKK
jgi:hypothetical protein